MSRWISDIYIRARMKQNPLLQGNCEYELWKQFVDQLVDAMPSIEITRCRDCKWNSECRMLDDDNGYCSQADRKTENSSEKPNNCEELNAYRECVKSRSFWDSKHCDGCYFDERCPFDEPKDEPTISKMEQVETMSCQECKHFHENAVMYLDQCDFCFKDCKYEPKDEPQTERSE